MNWLKLSARNSLHFELQKFEDYTLRMQIIYLALHHNNTAKYHSTYIRYVLTLYNGNENIFRSLKNLKNLSMI